MSSDTVSLGHQLHDFPVRRRSHSTFSPIGCSHTFGHNFRNRRHYLVLRQPRSSSFHLLECCQSNRIFRRPFVGFRSMHPILWMYFGFVSSWKWSRFDFLTWLWPDLPPDFDSVGEHRSVSMSGYLWRNNTRIHYLPIRLDSLTPLQRTNTTTCYSGPFPLGHLYLRDTCIQGTQNLVPEKNAHIIFVSVTAIEGAPLIRGKGHFFWVRKPGFLTSI